MYERLSLSETQDGTRYRTLVYRTDVNTGPQSISFGQRPLLSVSFPLISNVVRDCLGLTLSEFKAGGKGRSGGRDQSRW